MNEKSGEGRGSKVKKLKEPQMIYSIYKTKKNVREPLMEAILGPPDL